MRAMKYPLFNAYPENTTFGVLPAYGFYLRHVRGITLSNVWLELEKPTCDRLWCTTTLRIWSYQGSGRRCSATNLLFGCSKRERP